MTGHSLHEYLQPRVEALLREAEGAGFARDAAVAVVIDLATGSGMNTAPLPAEPPLPAGPWPDPAGGDPERGGLEVGHHLPSLVGHIRQPGRL